VVIEARKVLRVTMYETTVLFELIPLVNDMTNASSSQLNMVISIQFKGP
jgi:hypothetical protein